MDTAQNEKDENRKRVSLQFLKSVFILCLKHLMTNDNDMNDN